MEGFKGVPTIDDCIAKFFSEEELSDHYKCEKCKKSCKAKKKVYVSRTPSILVLHLKRFKIFPKKRKISDFVKFPLYSFSLEG